MGKHQQPRSLKDLATGISDGLADAGAKQSFTAPERT
jgi:hypothetical protein